MGPVPVRVGRDAKRQFRRACDSPPPSLLPLLLSVTILTFLSIYPCISMSLAIRYVECIMQRHALLVIVDVDGTQRLCHAYEAMPRDIGPNRWSSLRSLLSPLHDRSTLVVQWYILKHPSRDRKGTFKLLRWNDVPRTSRTFCPKIATFPQF